MCGELTNGSGPPVLLLAHGAGAPMDSPYMEMLAESLARHGIKVVRFEFEYMQLRRKDGKKRPPPKAGKLLEEYWQKIDQYIDANPLFIGGKSMGGRIASLIAAAEPAIGGCVCFGYPFHPPGKPDRWRTDHFTNFSVPVMIQQGTRDPFGRKAEVVAHFDEKPPVILNWLEDGEHDLKPRKASGKNQADLIQLAARSAADWMKSLADA